ncbi:hypothetical protein [Chitinophaga sp. Cy-1792]|uniref:hypothetical protein n=1 Tax=Chitinophaga sp. Cy-1792 TaxID=2608339 RepID=UPI00141E256F|nr:hypothetical protein [Chitinophaga sp. Cy-1792]NIG55639.1 hypothetical protein [Chitinophaga sp. Cy-1792]
MEHIERNKGRGFGQPVLKNRQLTVYSAIFHASYATSLEIFLQTFELTADELRSAISYCKNRSCDIMTDQSDQYCDGCVLRTIHDGWTPPSNDFVEIDGISYAKDDSRIFPGTLKELDDEEFGILGWVRAEETEKKWFS